MGNWPINPQWLSIVKGKSERNAEINSDGIFLPDTLRGFIADASSYKEINNPLSLFQVVNNNLIFEGEEADIIKRDCITDQYILGDILKCQNKQIIRIDSGSLFPNLPCCDKFRTCKGKELCYNIDGRIAILFHPHLPAINDPDYMARLDEVLAEYNSFHKLEGFYAIKRNFADESIIVKDPIERFYLWYTCPYSNLDEYFFPVTHKNRIIAVVMQGQRPNRIFKKDSVFKSYIQDSAELKESVDEIKDSFFTEESLSVARMGTIFSRIRRLEEMISDVVASKAQKYVSDFIKKTEDEYKAKLQEVKIIQNDSAFKEVKSSIGSALSSITQKFGGCDFISIFSQKAEVEMIDSSYVEFELIGSSDPNYKIKYLRFRKDLPYKNTEGKDLKDFMIDSSMIDDNDVFRMVVELCDGIRYVIWKRYGNWKDEYKELYDIYKDRIIAMYSNLLEPYYIFKSTMLEKQLANSMRFTSHESAQIIPLVINSVSDSFTQDIVENRMDYNKQYSMSIPSYIVVDSIYRLMLLSKLLKTPSLIFKDNEALKKTMKTEWTDIHRMIYSTKSLFEKKATLDKYQEICIDLEKQLGRKSLFIDYNYMSHILFNLVDNAIKYGIKGSRIIISAKEVVENYVKKIKISITNYGNSPIEDKKVIFDLYYRGKQSYIIEGTGMGLFVVKKLSSLLGLEVECSTSIQMVKGQNIPYVYYYKKNNNNYQLPNPIQDKLNKNIDAATVDDIVNKSVSNWTIGAREIQNNIDIDIYKNEFVVIIPLTENNIKEN